MSPKKIVGTVPILIPPNRKQIDELSPLGKKLMNVLNKKNYTKYAHVLDLKDNEPEIISSQIKEDEEKFKNMDVTTDGNKRNKRKIITAEIHSVKENVKVDNSVRSEPKLEVLHKMKSPDMNKCCLNLSNFVYKKQKSNANPVNKTVDKKNNLVNQFEKSLSIEENNEVKKTRVFEKKIRIEEYPINYYQEEKMYVELEKNLSKQSDENNTKFLTNDKYNHIKDWCDSQPFDNFREGGFEDPNTNETGDLLSSSSEELDDFTRLIMKTPKVKILDIKYLKEHEKLKIRSDMMKRDPVLFLDKFVKKNMKPDPKRKEIQSKITNILKANNGKNIVLNDNLVVKKNYKQQKISDMLKKR